MGFLTFTPRYCIMDKIICTILNFDYQIECNA